MIILAIDPGTRRKNPAGLAVIDTGGNQPQLLHAQTVFGDSPAEALRNVFLAGRSLVFSYGVEYVAYEESYLEENVHTLKALTAFAGVAQAITAACDLPEAVGIYPMQAKLALANDRFASKAAMVKMARLVFGRKLSSHEADACGIGLAGAGKLREAKILQMVERSS